MCFVYMKNASKMRQTHTIFGSRGVQSSHRFVENERTKQPVQLNLKKKEIRVWKMCVIFVRCIILNKPLNCPVQLQKRIHLRE